MDTNGQASESARQSSIENMLELLHIAEKLKAELRHSWLSDGRQESAAEHSWRMALMLLLIAPEIKLEIDYSKALKMALVHDLVEAEAYDIPAFEKGREEEKKKVEEAAAEHYKEILKSATGDEIYNLWHEYEEQKTAEAKFIKALDKLEVRIQHNEADIRSWSEIEFPRSLYVAKEFCEVDDFLREFNQEVVAESMAKMHLAGKDLTTIKKEVRRLEKK